VTTATAAIPEAPDRGIPQLNVRRGGMPVGVKLIIGLAIIVALLGAIAYVGVLKFQDYRQNSGPAEEKAETRARLPDISEAEVPAEVASDLPLPPEATIEADAAAVPPGTSASTSSASGTQVVPALTPEEQAQADLLARRQRAPLVAYDAGVAAGPTAGDPMALAGTGPVAPPMGWPFGQQAAAPDPSAGLRESLQPTVVAASSAASLRDPNMMLTQASVLPCVLNTAIDSTVPGMVSCTLSANVYSTNGRVLLLERGSRIVGQYQNAALKQGMRRVFVLWTRAETPRGVVIGLDSPASDSLGRSGVGGLVNNHFWQRFGAAMLLSVVDDTLAYATDRSSQGQGMQFTSTGQAGQDAAAIAVQNSVGIPPTLSVAPGGLLNVFVARDLDFGSVYSLRTASR